MRPQSDAVGNPERLLLNPRLGHQVEGDGRRRHTAWRVAAGHAGEEDSESKSRRLATRPAWPYSPTAAVPSRRRSASRRPSTAGHAVTSANNDGFLGRVDRWRLHPPRRLQADNDLRRNRFPAGASASSHPGRYDSDSDWFLIPSFGYNHQLTTQLHHRHQHLRQRRHEHRLLECRLGELRAGAEPAVASVNGQPVFATAPPGVPLDHRRSGGHRERRADPVTQPLAPVARTATPTAFSPRPSRPGSTWSSCSSRCLTPSSSPRSSPSASRRCSPPRASRPRAAALPGGLGRSDQGDQQRQGLVLRCGLHFGWYGEVNDQLALGCPTAPRCG
jgi:hypothetical protein